MRIRNFHFGIKRRKYAGVAVALMGVLLFNTIFIHRLSRKPEAPQTVPESHLPEENYRPESDHPMIRVVIKDSGFNNITHASLHFRAEDGLIIQSKDKEILIEPGTDWECTPEEELFDRGSVCIFSKNSEKKMEVVNLSRGCGVPSYRGKFELYKTAEGIVMVNELPAEEYLYGVVPSEMPASYHPEALKCQAVCARSYAYCQMRTFSYPEYDAHVDDSTSFQVYGNSGEKEATTYAVQETEGRKLWYKGNVITTYYYSTSCGQTTDLTAWGTEITEINDYLKSVAVQDEKGKDYEESQPWYRWSAKISAKTLGTMLEAYGNVKLGALTSVKISQTGPGGVAIELTATGTKGKLVVATENKIRRALGGKDVEIVKNDGKATKGMTLLPSAFFTIAKNGETYIIEGGGCGHGIGMSQNGANEMAKAGKTYEEILSFFYPGTEED